MSATSTITITMTMTMTSHSATPSTSSTPSSTIRYNSFNVVRHIESFAAGGSLHESLSVQLAQLKFIPTVERCMEGKHAIINKSSANRPVVSGQFVSLSLRMAEIRHRIANDDAAGSFMSKLIECFDVCRSGVAAANALGLQAHPRIIEFVRLYRANARSLGMDTWISTLSEVIYRTDLSSQFESHRAEQDFHKRSGCRGRRHRLHPIVSPSSPPSL